MPLVVLCGLPASGKTTRANELKEYFENHRNIRTRVVSDHGQGSHRNDTYHGEFSMCTFFNENRWKLFGI